MSEPTRKFELRDYYAGRAMQGFVTALKVQHVEKYSAPTIARLSYELADAMIAERAAEGSQRRCGNS